MFQPKKKNQKSKKLNQIQMQSRVLIVNKKK